MSRCPYFRSVLKERFHCIAYGSTSHNCTLVLQARPFPLHSTNQFQYLRQHVEDLKVIGTVEWGRVWLVRLSDTVIAGQVVNLHYNSFEISNVSWK